MFFRALSLLMLAPISIPKGPAPKIDGRIEPTEWAGSYEVPMPGAGRLMLRHDGRYLYVGIDGSAQGFPSACTVRGDSVTIMHSSAAVGTATYARGESDWKQRHGFTFALRSRDVSAAGMQAQADFLASNGWVASNSAMSPTQREMKISLSLFEPGNAMLALGYYLGNDGPVVRWPQSADDGCTALKTVQGFLPPSIDFHPDVWARLDFAP
jgi:hypothetical protein